MQHPTRSCATAAWLLGLIFAAMPSVTRSPAKLKVRLRGGPWLPARRVYVDVSLKIRRHG
jgi:hypothetical protein